MSNHPVGDGRDHRPPSARARAELSAGVASDLADARLRLQEAVLRAEGHRLLGDDRGLQSALADQGHILQDLRDRLGRTASVAVLQRDAEEVVAAAAAGIGSLDNVDVRVVTLDDHAVPAPPRRAPLLSGVASVVALVALAGAIVLGAGQGPTSPGLLEIAGQLDEVERQDAGADPTTSPVPVPAPAPGGATERSVDPTVAAGPTERARTAATPAAEEAVEPDDPDPRTLERIVEELHEVVNRFGLDPSARTDLPVQGDEDGQEADNGDPGDQDGTDGDAGDDDEDEEEDTDRGWLDGFSRDAGGE